MFKMLVPKVNNNDESYILLDWHVQDGQAVQESEILATLETSKATYDVVAEQAGVLHQLVQVDGECVPGALLAYLFESVQERDAFLSASIQSNVQTTSTVTLTKGAQELLAKHDIPEVRLRELGKALIKKADIEQLLNQNANGRKGAAVPKHQAAIAQTVSRSHATIPKAYLLLKVRCQQSLKGLQQLMEKSGVTVGLSELLIWTIARLYKDFPYFFGELHQDGTFTAASEANVGVTLDVGTGLFVPVIHGASAMTLGEIAKALFALRFKALRNTFSGEELTGGNIALSLNTEKDVVLVVPIILPPNTCMVSVAAVQEEVVMRDGGEIGVDTYFNLGVAYDHRVINGNDAVKFAGAIKAQIESGAIPDL